MDESQNILRVANELKTALMANDTAKLDLFTPMITRLQSQRYNGNKTDDP